MSLQERRALVIEDIVDEDQARRALVKERLTARLVDFMSYLNCVEQDGAIIYAHESPEGHDEDRKAFVEGYIDEMMVNEDDPIGELAYCNPSLES